MSDSAYGDLKVIRFEVTGVGSGLLMHNPAGMSEPASDKVGPKVIPTPEVEAERGVYRMASGQLYLPATHFRASIIGAASGQKIGKKSAPVIFSAGLFTLEEECPLYDPEDAAPLRDYEIDIRRAVVQKQGIRRARPLLKRWATEVIFQYEPLLLSPENIKSVFNLAGAIVGVGDYRPAKKGPFGRYSVEQIKS
jgi:hypothetical protein